MCARKNSLISLAFREKFNFGALCFARRTDVLHSYYTHQKPLNLYSTYTLTQVDHPPFLLEIKEGEGT